MGKDSKIEWTEHTFNPWWGCVRVSPACKHCYAEAFSHRMGLDLWGKGKERRVPSDTYWRQPVKWNEAAIASGRRARVFCASMSDVFEDHPDLDAPRRRLWSLIAGTPRLDWLLLTKRPENVGHLAPWRTRWPGNVWLGTTAETQAWANRRIPELLKFPARVHFVSCEPLLGSVNLSRWFGTGRDSINWVIAGGESGHHARPSNPEWFRQLRDECAANGVAFHFKQWGNWFPVDSVLTNVRQTRRVTGQDGKPILLVNIGKKAAGRRLDGVEWNAEPDV